MQDSPEPISGSETRRRAEFEGIMLPYMDSLYRSALSMTRSSSEAEDLVQETFLRAFQFFGQFSPGTNARAWLFRIMTNLFINTYRKRVREPERVSYDEMEDFYLYNRLNDAHSRTGGAGPTPEETVVQRVQLDAIREAIANLPEEYRDTVILADLNEFSYEEVAGTLGIPIGTVRSRLSRGRRLVQRALWAYTDDNSR
jgi:RNA polymerase sigma-70 factor (ECF subfamily)